MFKCDFCGKSSKLGEKRNLVVLETREKFYDYRYGVIPIRIERKTEFIDDRGGNGRETVKEADCCIRCLPIIKANEQYIVV